jgi:hypothetical protein
MHHRPPERAERLIVRGSWERPWRLTMESSASAGRVASEVLDPRRWWALALVLLVYAVVEAPDADWGDVGTILPLAGSAVLVAAFALTEGYQSAFLACAVLAGIGLALAFVLPGRPRKPAHELPELDPAADAAAAGDVVIRSGTK